MAKIHVTVRDTDKWIHCQEFAHYNSSLTWGQYFPSILYNWRTSRNN